MTDTTAPLTTVMLVFGGRSSEHQISCATASGVLRRSIATATA